MKNFLSEWKLRRQKRQLLRELYKWLAEGRSLGKIPNSPANAVLLGGLGVRVASVTPTGLLIDLSQQVHTVVGAYHREVVHA